MNKCILSFILILTISSSCSFKAENEGGKKEQNTQELKPEDLVKLDTDGDLINDLEEVKLNSKDGIFELRSQLVGTALVIIEKY